MKQRTTKHVSSNRKLIFTIGHSTRSFEAFVGLLRAHAVEVLADVRSLPRSLWVPQFNEKALARDLPPLGVDYIHLPGLGGRRKALRDSINTAWRNASFRGYADYMQTAEFQSALKELIRIATQKVTAIMCAEAVPWRCHRSLIADALVARGWRVLDIMDAGKARPHELPNFARVVGRKVIYPLAPAAGQTDLFGRRAGASGH